MMTTQELSQIKSFMGLILITGLLLYDLADRIFEDWKRNHK